MRKPYIINHAYQLRQRCVEKLTQPKCIKPWRNVVVPWRR